MKKYFMMAVMMLMLMPTMVSAFQIVPLTEEPERETIGDNIHITQTFIVKGVDNGYDGDVDIMSGAAKIGTKVSDFKIEAATGFDVTVLGDDVTVKGAAGENTTVAKGEEMQMFTVSYNFPGNVTEDEECHVSLNLDGVEITTQPETGLSLPVLVVGLGLIAAAGVYFVSRKNTKLFRI